MYISNEIRYAFGDDTTNTNTNTNTADVLSRNYAKIVLPAPPMFYIPSYGFQCLKQEMKCTKYNHNSTMLENDDAYQVIPPWIASPVPAIKSFAKPIQLPAPIPFLIPKGDVSRDLLFTLYLLHF